MRILCCRCRPRRTGRCSRYPWRRHKAFGHRARAATIPLEGCCTARALVALAAVVRLGDHEQLGPGQVVAELTLPGYAPLVRAGFEGVAQRDDVIDADPLGRDGAGGVVGVGSRAARDGPAGAKAQACHRDSRSNGYGAESARTLQGARAPPAFEQKAPVRIRQTHCAGCSGQFTRPGGRSPRVRKQHGCFRRNSTGMAATAVETLVLLESLCAVWSVPVRRRMPACGNGSLPPLWSAQWARW